MTCIEKERVKHEAPEKELLWVVWVDTNMGFSDEPDWEMNSAPRTLGSALTEAFMLRQRNWPAQVLQEGQTPRGDGLFSNPETD